MRKLMITLLAAAALTLTACAGSAPKHTANDAKGAITAAEHETKRAAKKLYEWRNTRKFIKKAKKALKAGDFDKAVKLANKAKNESTMALKQAKQQMNAGPSISPHMK